ncbi:PREDICTED: zinc finger BED domain-containing protein 4-like, partial [Cyphomyrmex costatus]|uniref:zinc finger BED domain-containing protein 4-like n=1 Tax=Cyphomyrmex costatus TaxID=456900 RepID=UPI0008523DD4
YHAEELKDTNDSSNELDISSISTTPEAEAKKIKKQKIITSYVSKKSLLYNETDEKKRNLDKLVALMIAKDLQPFSIVNDKGFQALVHALDPKYKLPNKTTLRNTILQSLFIEVNTKLQDILDQTEYVSFTTDLWSSMVGEGYITITCHFVLHGDLKTVVLETIQIEGNHTAEHIKEHIEKVIKKWHLKDKVQCIVTDNAQNMINACNLLKIRHLPCFAHTLNLTVNDGYFKKSTVAMDKLREEQRKRNLKQLKPLQEVATRWNSILYMIKRLIALNTEDCLIVTLSKLPKAPESLNFNNFIELNEMVKVLQPFETATNQISGQKYVTVSLIIPLVVGLYNNLTEIEHSLTSDIGKQLCTELKLSIVKRLFIYEQRTIPKVATLLDPRLKKYAFRNIENANSAQQLVQQEVAQLIRKEKQLHLDSEPSTSQILSPSSVSSISSESTKATTNVGLMDFLYQRISQVTNTSNATADSIIITRQYLELPTLELNENPISYWIEYPAKELWKIAERYICVP